MTQRRRRWIPVVGLVISIVLLLTSLYGYLNQRDETVKGRDDDFRLSAPRSYGSIAHGTRYALNDLFKPKSFTASEIELFANDSESYGFTVTVDPGAPSGSVEIISHNNTSITRLDWTPAGSDSLGKSLQHSFVGTTPFVRLSFSGRGIIMFLDYHSTVELANGDYVAVNTSGSRLGFLIDPAHLNGLGPNDRAVVEVVGQGRLKLRAWDHLFHDIGDIESTDTVQLPLRVGYSIYARLTLEVDQPQTVEVRVTTATFPAPWQPPWFLLVIVGVVGVVLFTGVLARAKLRAKRRIKSKNRRESKQGSYDKEDRGKDSRRSGNKRKKE